MRTKQEKILLDIIKLGGRDVTTAQIREKNPEMKLNLIHEYIKNLWRRGFLQDPKTINLHSFPVCKRKIISITKDKRMIDKIKRILAEELKNTDYNL